MKARYLCVLLLALTLFLCACQATQNIDADAGPSSHILFSTMTRTRGSFPTHAPTVPTTFVMPENCENGHTFLYEVRYCSVCGVEYYSAVLSFSLYEEGYGVQFGKCERTEVIVPDTYNGLPVVFIGPMYTVSWGPHKKVTHVVLPDSIRAMNQSAFKGYESLVSINIPEGITRIEATTFHGCQSMETFVLPAGVTYIGESAFGGCIKMKKLDLPEGLTELGRAAFNGCEALEELVIPEGITEIPNNLLSYCYSLKKVTYADAVTKIGQGAFMDCTSLPNAVIGENVTEIGKLAFSGCSAIKNVVIPDAVGVIGSKAFANCESLEWIVIGSGVEVLGNDLFSGSANLRSIYYQGTQEQWGNIRQQLSTREESTVSPPVFNGVSVYFYSETQPTQPGNYWRYVDGVPTLWETEE